MIPPLAALALLLLALAAWRDIAARTIPDTACLALAALGLGLRGAMGWTEAAASLAAAALLFGCLLALHARGIVGGGDVKLASAVAVGLAPPATWDFIVATALAGGLLSLPYLGLPRLLRTSAVSPAGPRSGGVRRVLAIETWRLRRGGPLPYGVAIAAGGALVILHMPGN